MTTEKEAIYDEQINPLMAEILRICKEHKIAFLADFSLGYDEESDNPDSPLKCTSCLLEDDHEPTEEMLAAYKLLRPQHIWAAFTVRQS